MFLLLEVMKCKTLHPLAQSFTPKLQIILLSNRSSSPPRPSLSPCISGRSNNGLLTWCPAQVHARTRAIATTVRHLPFGRGPLKKRRDPPPKGWAFYNRHPAYVIVGSMARVMCHRMSSPITVSVRYCAGRLPVSRRPDQNSREAGGSVGGPAAEMLFRIQSSRAMRYFGVTEETARGAHP